MSTFKVPASTGDTIEITVVDGGLIKTRTWAVVDGLVEVPDPDSEIFIKHVTGAELATAGETSPEEAPPVEESSNAK